MHIKRFVIENFRRFERVEFDFNGDLNVLTGVNNSGKTSVLEAVALWAECFDKLVRPLGKEVKRLGLRRGQYWFGDTSNYFASDAIQSVRSNRYGDIFASDSAPVRITAEVVSATHPETLSIGFVLRAARGLVYDVAFNGEPSAAVRFNEMFTAFPRPIETVFVSHVAAILTREEFATRPAINAKVLARDSMSVLRNRLYQLKKQPERYGRVLDDASFVLFNRALPVEFDFEGDEARDVDLVVKVRADPRELFRDLCLLGSGSLQVLEILLGLHGERRDLNLVLLDEPDSHLHRDLQRRLLDVLMQRARESNDTCQVFVTTHNEGLIRSTRADHLFHLEAVTTKSYRPIVHDDVLSRHAGLQPSRHVKVLQSLGNETALDLLNALESDRLVLVEGDDDARYIQAIVERVSARNAFRSMYWAFGGVDGLLLNLDHYRTGIFEAVRNQRTLWEKSALVFDADYVTDAERVAIEAALKARRGYEALPMLLWPAYTLEATVLIDVAKLAATLVELVRRDVNAPLDAAEIERVTREEFDALVERYTVRLRDGDLLKRIEGQRISRAQNLEVLIPNKKLLRMFGEYLSEANRMLDAGKVHHLARKEDLADLVAAVYQRLGHTLQRDGLFDRIIQSTTPHSRPSAWNDLVDTVR
jgi:predicted ATPase